MNGRKMLVGGMLVLALLGLEGHVNQVEARSRVYVGADLGGLVLGFGGYPRYVHHRPPPYVYGYDRYVPVGPPPYPPRGWYRYNPPPPVYYHDHRRPHHRHHHDRGYRGRW
ncbi:hypothetical protein Despr_0379 [Desulfobulbus propionicus DSM 2032]|jgi:hypothetical protein|uniref:Uncharacterized protein n=1 Tax=Desulfobulbus propionicus (strain ATCC 33891 / DSM 2032 / VKM B-1956 / 1pr3) TaxID=577650 RepID=A0A7U4DMZ2_DESPD|nr:hypothetical protein [Desulfobulbus propionicus]ADW16561.1 hypothetical protein Despr_0379 [Desulfobulbus propionicus DSM 2032]